MHFASEVWTDEHFLVVKFEDGRVLAVPKAWFPKLERASEAELTKCEISPFGLHWPDLDEDVSLKGLLDGQASCFNV